MCANQVQLCATVSRGRTPRPSFRVQEEPKGQRREERGRGRLFVIKKLSSTSSSKSGSERPEVGKREERRKKGRERRASRREMSLLKSYKREDRTHGRHQSDVAK